MANNNTITTGRVRLSYEHLMKPFANQLGAEEKYSVTLLIPKTDVQTKQRLDAAIQTAINDGIASKWSGARPPQVPTPIHDGDGVKQNGEAYGDECRGHWVMTASSKNKPEIVDANLNPIIDASQIYSGMFARVSIRFFPYNSNGKRGIGCGLGNVQKLEDGEPLGGKTTAAEDFGAAAAPWNQPAPQQYQQPYSQPQAQYPQTGYPPQATYQQAPVQPTYQQPYAAPQIDPITGLPLTNPPAGGVMGL
jgi:hypothetical protein